MKGFGRSTLSSGLNNNMNKHTKQFFIYFNYNQAQRKKKPKWVVNFFVLFPFAREYQYISSVFTCSLWIVCNWLSVSFCDSWPPNGWGKVLLTFIKSLYQSIKLNILLISNSKQNNQKKNRSFDSHFGLSTASQSSIMSFVSKYHLLLVSLGSMKQWWKA